MKLFLDTANLDEIKQAVSLGVLDGVTTNPSLIAKEGAKFEQRIHDICELVQGPVSAEVVSTEAEAMYQEAQRLKKIHKWVVVKLPTIPEGLKAAKRLVAEGFKINMTLCFSATQALLVGKLGVAYVSPFVGRLDDISAVGMELIRDIVTIYRNYSFKTEVLSASLRHPLHVVDAAKAGSDVATMPFKVFDLLLKHPLTDKGLAAFLKDWDKVKDKVL